MKPLAPARPGFETRGWIPERLRVWIDARKRHHLSDVQVQMACELGMNPKKLGKFDNHEWEPWKLPLPEFIEDLSEAGDAAQS